ncbi:hypothetical protein Y032_0651g1139 [Ancylostoma ceylanicum]|uniref:SXP/RAL-2 family protein Ani s 5-like cation-binding domain-containing protein n=1 Tax=Ancylostoma ceylanicum TaxID=53326 RepID=A0A016WIE1_9BILA|nr:hypothetical protein Y032_0651g1139 [Ancylostoma ceylanicum]
MFLLLLYTAIVGVAICRPQMGTHMNASFPSGELSEEELQEYCSFMKIIRDTAMTKDQKLEKVRAMLANESAEETKEALEQTQLAIDLNDFLMDQAKNASPKVKEAIFKIYDLLCDATFLKKTPEQKVAEIEAVVNNLNDSEKKELEQLDEVSKKKAKELGIELPSQITKKRR